jgi:predicted transcriptional regulator
MRLNQVCAICGRWYDLLMNKTTLYLPPETQRSLRDLARRTGRHQADVIREALDLYLQLHGERPRPRSIGAGEDGELAARDSEDWLRNRWRHT